MKVKLLIIGRDPLLLAGLKAIIDQTDTALIVGTATEVDDGRHAFQKATPHPDVIILAEPNSTRFVYESILKIVSDLRHREARPKFIVVSRNDDDDAIVAALRAGASGYLSRVESSDDLLDAIRIAAKGGAVFSANVAGRFSAYFSAMHNITRRAKLPALTNREMEILELLSTGSDNRQIAKTLFLAEKTVRNYVSRIFAKLEVSDRTMAAVRARDAGLGL